MTADGVDTYHLVKGAGRYKYVYFNVKCFLNIMFQAPMGRFQLESNLKLPLLSGFTFVPFNWLS
jgi:hypothetical protein